MTRISFEERRRLERMTPSELSAHQLARRNGLLARILPHNRFYAEKLADVRLPLTSLDQLDQLPYTFKDELQESVGGGDFAANVTFPIDRYVRYHRTSGTRGRPRIVLDTLEDWNWWIGTWQFVLDVAEIGPHDRVLMAFSFGPFIGFWSAYDAVVARGAMAIPTGAMSSLARLDMARADDMLIVRGVNIFPSSVEQIIHGFPEIVEYQMTTHKRGVMDELTIATEDRLEAPERVAEELFLRLGLRVTVKAVALGSLPRYEGKGRRFVDQR